MFRTALVAIMVVGMFSGARVQGPSQGARPLEAALDLAWDISRGAGVTVGIVDTGFDFFHPALKGRLEPAYFAPDVFHFPASPILSHGTAVASVIGARRDGPNGMAGVAPECRMLAASRGMPEHTLMRLAGQLRAAGVTDQRDVQKMLLAERAAIQEFGTRWGRHTGVSTSEAIRFLVDRGARVIAIPEYLALDLLTKSPQAEASIQTAFTYAAERDVLIVIGAGNNDRRIERYPGSPETVAVAGAASAAGDRWTRADDAGRERQGSNYGPRLTVLAPAANLRIAVPHEPAFYRWADSPVGVVDETFSGPYREQVSGATSLATAIVAGLAVLIRSAAPDLSAADTIDVLRRGARDVGALGRDDETGSGLVDFVASLHLARARAGKPSHRRVSTK